MFKLFAEQCAPLHGYFGPGTLQGLKIGSFSKIIWPNPIRQDLKIEVLLSVNRCRWSRERTVNKGEAAKCRLKARLAGHRSRGDHEQLGLAARHA